ACGDEGGKTGRFEAGLLEIREVAADRAHPTLYPVGCCFLCPRAAFLDLEGYDDAFAPFFWEDVDLGWRAWAPGLRTFHVPARGSAVRVYVLAPYVPWPSRHGAHARAWSWMRALSRLGGGHVFASGDPAEDRSRASHETLGGHGISLEVHAPTGPGAEESDRA